MILGSTAGRRSRTASAAAAIAVTGRIAAQPAGARSAQIEALDRSGRPPSRRVGPRHSGMTSVTARVGPEPIRLAPWFCTTVADGAAAQGTDATLWVVWAFRVDVEIDISDAGLLLCVAVAVVPRAAAELDVTNLRKPEAFPLTFAQHAAVALASKLESQGDLLTVGVAENDRTGG